MYHVTIISDLFESRTAFNNLEQMRVAIRRKIDALNRANAVAEICVSQDQGAPDGGSMCMWTWHTGYGWFPGYADLADVQRAAA